MFSLLNMNRLCAVFFQLALSCASHNNYVCIGVSQPKQQTRQSLRKLIWHPQALQHQTTMSRVAETIWTSLPKVEVPQQTFSRLFAVKEASKEQVSQAKDTVDPSLSGYRKFSFVLHVYNIALMLCQ